MSPTAKMLISSGVNFIIVGGSSLTGYMVANGQVVMPSAAMCVLVIVLGLVGAAKDVQAFLSSPS